MTIIILIGIIAAFAYYKIRDNKPIIGAKHKKRLAISAKITLDKTQNLILIRRDNVEHLILTINDAVTIIESNITQNTPNTNTETIKKEPIKPQITPHITQKHAPEKIHTPEKIHAPEKPQTAETANTDFQELIKRRMDK